MSTPRGRAIAAAARAGAAQISGARSRPRSTDDGAERRADAEAGARREREGAAVRGDRRLRPPRLELRVAALREREHLQQLLVDAHAEAPQQRGRRLAAVDLVDHLAAPLDLQRHAAVAARQARAADRRDDGGGVKRRSASAVRSPAPPLHAPSPPKVHTRRRTHGSAQASGGRGARRRDRDATHPSQPVATTANLSASAEPTTAGANGAMGRTRGVSRGAWPLATVAEPSARAWEADDVVWLWRDGRRGGRAHRVHCAVGGGDRGAEIAGSPRAGSSDADEGVLVRPQSHLKTRRAGGASQEQLEGFAEGFGALLPGVPGDKKFAEAVAEGLELAARRLTVVEGMHFPKVAANALLTLDPEGRGAGAVAVVVDRAGEEIAPCDATALVSIRVLPVAGAPELPGGTKVPRGFREPPQLSQATAADGSGPGFSHDDHVLTKQDMGGGAAVAVRREAQLFERLAANMCTISTSARSETTATTPRPARATQASRAITTPRRRFGIASTTCSTARRDGCPRATSSPTRSAGPAAPAPPRARRPRSSFRARRCRAKRTGGMRPLARFGSRRATRPRRRRRRRDAVGGAQGAGGGE